MTELEKKLSEQNEQLTRIISTLTQTIDDLNRTIVSVKCSGGLKITRENERIPPYRT